jgi:hypothetical protein
MPNTFPAQELSMTNPKQQKTNSANTLATVRRVSTQGANPILIAAPESDIPKNDWAYKEPVLKFLPIAILFASTAVVVSTFVCLALSKNRGLSVAIGTCSGALTLFGLCKYKSTQVKAQIDRIKTDNADIGNKKTILTTQHGR